MRGPASFLRLDEVDSTNIYLAAKAGSLPAGSVVYSTNQRAGRGRKNREWFTPSGQGLATSVLIDAPPAGVLPTWIPLVAGWAAATLCHGLGISLARLKWPNDVLVAGAKLSGILVEGTTDGRYVVGWGINVYSSPDLHPDNPSTSLSEAGVEITDIESELVSPWVDALLGELSAGSLLSPTEGVSRWRRLVVENMDSIGREISVDTGDGSRLSGQAVGLSDDGGLIVETGETDSPFVVHAGDVFHLARS